MLTTMNQTMAIDMTHQCEYCNETIWHDDDKKWYPHDLSDSEYEKTIKEYGSGEGAYHRWCWEDCWGSGDEDDGQPDEAQEWHDFDPDC